MFFLKGRCMVGKPVSAEELMEYFVVGRDMEIVSNGRTIRGPISVILARDTDICIRYRWTAQKRSVGGKERWELLGHTEGFTKISGPVILQESGEFTGTIGDSRFCIYPLKQCIQQPSRA